MNEISLVSPGHFGSGPENILQVENLIDKEDLGVIQNFLPTITEWMDSGQNQYDKNGVCIYDASYWTDRQCDSDILLKTAPHIYELIKKYIYKLKLIMQDFYKVKLYERPPVIIKWKPGTEQQPHADKQLNDGSPNPFPIYDLNSLIYYNDDFEGGELYYPEFNLQIKPKPGLAVAHPGDIFYLHGVKKIISGERYTTPSFYTITEIN